MCLYSHYLERRSLSPIGIAESLFLRALFLHHASDSYILLIKDVVKYLLVLFFSSSCGCCGQKHSDIDLISEMPCPKASNQYRAVSLNSLRKSPVLGACCKKWQQEMESSGKETYCISDSSRNNFPIQISHQVAW